ncbi:XTP/dITP diphosphohydrolase [Catenibacillus scindens]|uniref:dITP/XTP pyrophosphatase n=1 Tax=Catenibacillus scindens TaxID=673271 RepID=A0A7W8M4S2_9FIRM|nr:XTP/dITP diphosphatase [Catenibacillus scindens]MBB5264310.1 XTP/dITP diphosphohydrolase [Catenibacillus scindens]
MKKIIFATGNEGKMKEIRMILEDLPVQVLSLKEAGINSDIVEDGETFEENALIKARTIHDLTGELVLADDSGLEVDYMNKAPGVYSARFLGEDTSYAVKNQYIIDQLREAKGGERSARFVCVIAAVFPDGTAKTCQGVIEGEIGYEPAGENGFGYDPIFYVPEYGCSTAQLPPEIKNKISHRGKALEAMKKVLEEYLQV